MSSNLANSCLAFLLNVSGIDFSDFGCKTHNPRVLSNLIVGDITQEMNKLVATNKKFDVIWLDNVLEHVAKPLVLLKSCKKLAKKNALLVIEVPNDFSKVQLQLLEMGYVPKPYWVIPPDHISYFNSKALNSLCKTQGWLNLDLIADFPIDFFLFNIHTNYVKNSKVGKDSHLARVKIENFINNLPELKKLNIYRVLAEAGLGRQIIGFYKNS